MKTPSIKASVPSGFSLVELLVVIAVIAIIAAIAIPNIANITGSARESSYQRNAQNIASVASAARAAGYTNAWPTTVQGLVGVLATGISNTVGEFRVDAVPTDTETIAGITKYLTIDTEKVVYNPAGTSTNETP